MKRVLIAYFSVGGATEKMAAYIAEGIRFSGQQAVTRKIGDIKNETEIADYDGYIFGSPTYSQDMPKPMKTFLLMAERAGLEGKMGGAFGSYAHDVGYKHDTYAPAIIFDEMQHVGKMKPFELGPFTLKEDIIKTSWRRSTLLVLAITLHNIPEGLAVGVAFGGVGMGNLFPKRHFNRK
jgi:flavodoxin